MKYNRAKDGALEASCLRNVSFMSRLVQQRHFEDNSAFTSTLDDDINVDEREVYFLIMHFLSSGPCQRATVQLWNELLQYKLLPRRYHAWYSRSSLKSGDEDDDGSSFPLSYIQVVERYPEIENRHLVKLLQQQLINCRKATRSLESGNLTIPTAADIPTLLGHGQFSLLDVEQEKVSKKTSWWMLMLRWPHWQSDQVHALGLRELGGGFARHHRSPSIRAAINAIVKPSMLADRVQIIKKFRGHRNAVFCAIFDKTGQYVITGSDDRLVKIWSVETGFCLCSCRGHEGDVTNLAVSSGNTLLASASNDCTILVWHLPDGQPVSILRGHTGAVTAISFSPRQGCEHHLLSSSDDGTCRMWDARDSSINPRVYTPKPDINGISSAMKPSGEGQLAPLMGSQVLCCAFNTDGSTFVTGSSDRLARVWDACKWHDVIIGKPNYEFDVLKGHDNDINYVQFSCVGPVNLAPVDVMKDESLSGFKNSWFVYENIITCSRDGSAIIWTSSSDRFYTGSAHWVKAYHLRVPPPPMPPPAARGLGPRQRLLPTPQGVNAILWSLDNRFILAAIMDCRICVWNAVDGSLLHSLTGHVKSTYVLDVHPFNPRIAMSAGSDGRVIIWDIWEGCLVHAYEVGEFNLVDGNFSPDGTNIVVSDEVGQIYLLGTGQGESQKDAKYDQFFLGDFFPLIGDTQGNVTDQETELAAARRNIQDLLCDAYMIPYPEPYQSMYQHRRLGALWIECQPSFLNLTSGTVDDATDAGAGLGLSMGTVDRNQVDGLMQSAAQPLERPDVVVDWDQEVISEETTNIDAEVYKDNKTTEEIFLQRSYEKKQKSEGQAFLISRKQASGRYDYQEIDNYAINKRHTRHRQDLDSSMVVAVTQQKSGRPKRLAAKNVLELSSHVSANDEEQNEHLFVQPVRNFLRSKEGLEASRFLPSKLQLDDPCEQEIQEMDLDDACVLENKISSKMEKSKLGEFSRRGGSKRKHFVSLRGRGTQISNSGFKGSQEEEESLLGVKESEMIAKRSPLRGKAAKLIRRHVMTHTKSSHCAGLKSLLGIGDGGDSNDIEDEVDALEISHADELPECFQRPLHVEMWKYRKVPPDRESDCMRVHASHGNLSCNGDKSASNNKEYWEATGNTFKKSFLTCCKIEASDVDKSSRLRSPISFTGFATSRFQKRKIPEERESLEVSPDSKAYLNCKKDKNVISHLEWKPDPSETQLQEVVDDDIIIRSRTAGSKCMQGYSRELLLDLPSDIHWIVSKEEKMLDQKQLGEIMLPVPDSMNGSGDSPINKKDLTSEENLEDHGESHFSPTYSVNQGGSYLNVISNELATNKDEISKEMTVKHDCMLYYEHGLTNDMAQKETKVIEKVRSDISEGDKEGAFPPDYETWSELKSDATNNKDGQNLGHNKKRTLGELHFRPVLRSSSSMHNNTDDDFVTKRRVRNMKSVMSEGIKERALKKGKGERSLMTRCNGATERTHKHKHSPNKHKQRHSFGGRNRSILEKNTVNVDYEHAGTFYRDIQEESDKMQVAEVCRLDEDGIPLLNQRRNLRASLRVRRGALKHLVSWKRDNGRFSEPYLHTKQKAVRSKRSSEWLLISDVDRTRYIPQFGDNIVYLRQGHQEFLDSCQKFEDGPWMMYDDLIEAAELCRVIGLDYAILPESGDTVCRLVLEFSNPNSSIFGKSFKMSFPELKNFPDFLVEKNRYDAAIERNWTCRDKCQVWWSSADGKGGSWWDGRVISVKAKSLDFADSPWERFLVQYRGDTSGPQTHSPWELFDSKCCKWEPPHINEGTKAHLSSVLEKLDSSKHSADDQFGMRRLRQLACRVDFINRVPLPLTLDIIKLRLERDYYRSYEAFSFDVRILVSNAERYLESASELSQKLQRLVQCLLGSYDST